MSNVLFPMQPLSTLIAAIKDGTHGTHRRVAEGVPLLSAKNISANGEIALDDSDDLISEAEYLDLTRSFQLQPDDLLLTIVGSLGRRAIYSGQRVTFQRSVAYLRPYQQKVLTRFLFHWMGHPAFTSELVRRSNATAQAGLYLGELAKVSAPAPDLREQGKVAQVLDTLDTAIHETETIIAKLKAVKQGLLHDLLTRGIDANGELRPLQDEAPHLYKQSALGWIPREWDVPVFGDTVDHIIDFRGRTPKKLGMDWGSGDILALSANNVQPGGIDVSREAYFGGERLYSKWMTSGDVRKGDVLLTMEAPLGNVAQIPDDARYILSQRVIALRFKPDKILNDFAFWQMQSTEFQRAMAKRSTGSTATGIQRAELVKLCFKVPPVKEQSWVAQRLFSVEQKLASELVALEKLKLEKSGLMDDLLTGHVRVTPLLNEAAQKVGSA